MKNSLFTMKNSLFTMKNSLFTMKNSLLNSVAFDFIGLKYPTNHYNHFNQKIIRAKHFFDFFLKTKFKKKT